MVQPKKDGGLWTNEELRKLFATPRGKTKEQAIREGYICARWAEDIGLCRGMLGKRLQALEKEGLATKERITLLYGDRLIEHVAYKLSDGLKERLG